MATIKSHGLAVSECNAEFVSGEWSGADGYRPALSASVDSIAAIRVIVEPESGKQYFVQDQQHLVTRITAVKGGTGPQSMSRKPRSSNGH